MRNAPRWAPGSRRTCRDASPRRAARVPVLLGAALLALPAVARAQEASIQGIVTSASTGGPQEGVAILLEADGRQARATVTDRNGYYQIGGIPPGSYLLRSRHIAHVDHQQTVVFAAGQRVTASFRLEPAAVALEGVVVSGERGATVTELGRQRVTPADLRLVPVPAGSGDLASYLQTLPGVTTTGDRGGQLFVRGGTAAENLVLVDGIPIYQPFHILGFFSVFPEDLVSSVDFYASGFGARYSGRTSSVLDVGLRDGNPNGFSVTGSLSPFVAEGIVQGPLAPGLTGLVSVRRSLIDATSETLLGTRQPITFDSQLFKLTTTTGDDLRCSVLGLRTFDRGRLDPEQDDSHLDWRNLLLGGRCVAQLGGFLRLLESNFSYSRVDNAAVSRGSSRFHSTIERMQHDAHTTSMVGAVPLFAGYHLYTELTDYNLAELFGLQVGRGGVYGFSGYAELALALGGRIELRPGVVLTAAPRPGVEPRVRASWEPFGSPDQKLQGALGLYRQDVIGTSDMRDVGSVFVAWMESPDDRPVESMHAMLGWQQSLGGGLRWSVEGYYKRLQDIPVPRWSAVARFATRLGPATGETYGVDGRMEYRSRRLHGFVGYGYGSTAYETAQTEFTTWFGDSVQRYHPPHDRRHQVNAVANLDLGGFTASARWQLGTGLPFTRPLGFEETFDFTEHFHDVSASRGTTRLILDRPFNSRLPIMHRLDLSVEREFELALGVLTAQVGAINAYDRRNMFYYDLFSGRRVDQLPLAPYAAITVRP